MPRKMCSVAGFALLAAGFIGFAEPHFLGMHLTTIHNVVHLATGGLALYFGYARPSAARGFAMTFGSIYLLLGVLGFVAPQLLGRIIGHTGDFEARAFLADNLVHLALGVVFLTVAMTAAVPRHPPMGVGRA